MPDITMCSSTKCPLRWDCARSRDSGTKPLPRQSYSSFPWAFVDDDTRDAHCAYQVPLDPDRPD